MTQKARLKFGLFLVGAALTVLLALVVVVLVTQFAAYFQQGANPASIFRGHTLYIPNPTEARWVRATADEGKVPTRAEADEIIASYYEAWNTLSQAQRTGDTSDLLTRWAGAAYDEALASIDPTRRVPQTHRGHQLVLRYLSLDSSVVSFDDVRFVLEQDFEGQPLTLEVSASVVMTLDQGFWRIRQIALTYQS